MNSKVEASSSSLDIAKLVVAIGIVLAAISAFYYFAEYSQLARVIALLVLMGGAIALALTTTRCIQFSAFFRDSRLELRKVVWPSRQETLQTSLAVILVVIIMGIFLWLLDMLLFWILNLLVG